MQHSSVIKIIDSSQYFCLNRQCVCVCVKCQKWSRSTLLLWCVVFSQQTITDRRGYRIVQNTSLHKYQVCLHTAESYFALHRLSNDWDSASAQGSAFAYFFVTIQRYIEQRNANGVETTSILKENILLTMNFSDEQGASNFHFILLTKYSTVYIDIVCVQYTRQYKKVSFYCEIRSESFSRNMWSSFLSHVFLVGK